MLLVYYPLVMIAQLLASDAYMTIWVAQWMPNIVVGTLGMALMIWGIRR